MKTIYKSFLNEICSFEVPENAFESEENYNKYLDHLLNLLDANIINERLKALTFIAIKENCQPGYEYMIHKFKEYIGISKYIDDYEPREMAKRIIVLDEHRIYPLQEIEITIDFVYNYKY